MEEASIGLKRGMVKIDPYNPMWTKMFEREKQSLLEMFGDRILAIEHIGSTAVPGLPAKPIIDINVAIASLADIQDFKEKLPKLGYLYLPKRSYPVPEYANRHLFIKGSESSRTHHLKLVMMNDKDGWEDPILFRDYLRSNACMRDTYTELKKQLAEKYADDRENYTKNKAEFIEDAVRQARKKNFHPN